MTQERSFVFADGDVWSEQRLNETLLAAKGSRNQRAFAVIEPYQDEHGSRIPTFYHCRLYTYKYD